MLEENRLLGEGKTIERRVSLSRIVSAEGFTPCSVAKPGDSHYRRGLKYVAVPRTAQTQYQLRKAVSTRIQRRGTLLEKFRGLPAGTTLFSRLAPEKSSG